MKYITILYLLGLLCGKSLAQEPEVFHDSIYLPRIICTEPISDNPPLLVLRMKNSEHFIDTLQLKKIDYSWIRKAKVSKNTKYNDEGKNGVIVIIPKRRSEDQITEALELK